MSELPAVRFAHARQWTGSGMLAAVIINLKYFFMENNVNKIKEILSKIAVARLQMQDELAKMERSECTRKIQIGITNCEQAELWFSSAIKEAEYVLEQRGYS